LTQLFSRGGSAFNQFVNPIGMQNLGWKYYIVYVAWLAVETTIIFFLYPETKGPSLEEVAAVMEGSEAKVGGLALGEKKVEVGEVQEIEKV
jgi:hypothetical protein